MSRSLAAGRRVLAAACLVLVLGASVLGCGVSGDDTPRAIDPAEIPEPLKGSTSTTQPVSVPIGPDIPVYVILTAADGQKRLTPYETRFDNPDPGPQDLLSTLLALEELGDDSLSSAIPPDVDLVGYGEDDGVATIALSEEFENMQGVPQIQAVAQLVYTATELGTVDSVQFQIDDELISVPNEEGTLRRAVSRDDFTRLSPDAT